MKEKVDVRKMAKEIDAALRKGGSKARREATLGYFPSKLENLGVAVPHLRTVVRGVRKRLKGHEPAVALELAQAVVDQGTLEGRQAAYEIVAAHDGAIDVLRIREIEALGRGIDNWVSVDTFCCGVAGPARQMGSISDRDVMRWVRSKDRWWRRAAIVATVPLNARSKGGTPGGNTRRTLMVLEVVASEKDPMIAKAVSWALRSMVETDRMAVERFLRENNGDLPAIVRREVGNKLRTGLKNPRSRA